jgi:hypothetical protein
LRRHCSTPPKSRCCHGHTAAVPAHRRGPDDGVCTHVPAPTRATTRAPAWRGQGQAFGSLSRLTSSVLRPSTGRGFASDGNPSSPEVRAPTRSRSCTLTLAHECANPVVAFPTSSETKAPRSRPPHRSVSPHLRGRPSVRLGARASGQVSAHVRPQARTQANTPACRRGARRHGQATGMPTRSSEEMDAVFGQPMLTHAREGQGLAFLWPDLV